MESDPSLRNWRSDKGQNIAVRAVSKGSRGAARESRDQLCLPWSRSWGWVSQTRDEPY